jgi:hypothetical protein
MFAGYCQGRQAPQITQVVKIYYGSSNSVSNVACFGAQSRYQALHPFLRCSATWIMKLTAIIPKRATIIETKLRVTAASCYVALASSL